MHSIIFDKRKTFDTTDWKLMYDSDVQQNFVIRHDATVKAIHVPEIVSFTTITKTRPQDEKEDNGCSLY